MLKEQRMSTLRRNVVNEESGGPDSGHMLSVYLYQVPFLQACFLFLSPVKSRETTGLHE